MNIKTFEESQRKRLRALQIFPLLLLKSIAYCLKHGYFMTRLYQVLILLGEIIFQHVLILKERLLLIMPYRRAVCQLYFTCKHLSYIEGKIINSV